MVFWDGQMTKSEAVGTHERVVLRCLKHVKAKGYFYIRTDSVQEWENNTIFALKMSL